MSAQQYHHQNNECSKQFINAVQNHHSTSFTYSSRTRTVQQSPTFNNNNMNSNNCFNVNTTAVSIATVYSPLITTLSRGNASRTVAKLKQMRPVAFIASTKSSQLIRSALAIYLGTSCLNWHKFIFQRYLRFISAKACRNLAPITWSRHKPTHTRQQTVVIDNSWPLSVICAFSGHEYINITSKSLIVAMNYQ